MVKKITSSCSMGAIWRQVVCIVIVLLFLVEKKMLTRIWLPAQNYRRNFQGKKKIPLDNCCLLVKKVLTFGLCMMFEDALKLKPWRFLTYFLRFNDDMKEEDSEETHVASTKQLNIRHEKGKKKNRFYSQAATFLE